jgi:hypothetical protein
MTTYRSIRVNGSEVFFRLTDVDRSLRFCVDYASFARFADPDGNTWVQERGHRSE